MLIRNALSAGRSVVTASPTDGLPMVLEIISFVSKTIGMDGRFGVPDFGTSRTRVRGNSLSDLLSFLASRAVP